MLYSRILPDQNKFSQRTPEYSFPEEILVYVKNSTCRNYIILVMDVLLNAYVYFNRRIEIT